MYYNNSENLPEIKVGFEKMKRLVLSDPMDLRVHDIPDNSGDSLEGAIFNVPEEDELLK